MAEVLISFDQSAPLPLLNHALHTLRFRAVTISAWHESYGEQIQEVTITGSETKTINFVFKAKPY